MIGRRIIAGIMATMIFSLASCGVATENDKEIYNDNNNISNTVGRSRCDFLLDEKSGEFSVSSNDDFAWQSSPVLGGFDSSASGAERTNQRSLLLISYLDAEGNISEASSYIASFKKEGMLVNKTENGALITFDFTDIGITIPLELICKDNFFEASIKTKDIKETGDNKLLTVSLLPYFGAGAVSEDGYLLIPDGCGALVSFDLTDAYTKTYEKNVYGENSLLYKKSETTVEEQIYMPVFGVKRGDNAMLCVITKGDSISAINANLSTGYYTAFAKFVYRQEDTSHLMEGSSKEKVVSIASKSSTTSDFSVRYMFLQGDEANYIGMAECYRNYLIKNYGISSDKKSQGISLDISFTATAEIDKSFLGIPYKGLETFTTLSDVENVYEQFKKADITNYNFSLAGAFPGGSYGKVPNKVKITSQVGNLKSYEEINTKIRDQKGGLFLLTNFQRAYKTGNSVSKTYDTARDVSGAIKQVYEFYPDSYAKNEDRGWYLLNASALENIVGKFVKDVKKYDANIGLTEMANELYGDYRLNSNSDRADILKSQISAFESLYDAVGDIYFQKANIYALKYSHMISDIPTSSSQYDLFTVDVPFYQAVIHGVTDYSCSAVNLSGDTNYALLKAIEYGTALRYDLICRNNDEVYKSSANNLFSADKDVWLERIIDTEKNISEFYRSNANSTIVAHTKLIDGVYRTDYSNGNATIVNYNNNSVKIDDKLVEANSFLLLQKGV